ncbi:MAG TPA: hypothetical protein VHD31_02920 [Candidatus Paceibacterota bacterium]|nr:hypothetical protein [Candidatus Paceibacterota bacterium]
MVEESDGKVIAFGDHIYKRGKLQPFVGCYSQVADIVHGCVKFFLYLVVDHIEIGDKDYDAQWQSILSIPGSLQELIDTLEMLRNTDPRFHRNRESTNRVVEECKDLLITITRLFEITGRRLETRNDIVRNSPSPIGAPVFVEIETLQGSLVTQSAQFYKNAMQLLDTVDKDTREEEIFS